MTTNEMQGIPRSSIHRNPFWVLRATVRDDRRRIVALAEEMALRMPHDTCQKARADLTNPRNRLGAEVQWMPGVSPKKAREAAEALLRDPVLALSQEGLPALATANLMSSAFEALDVNLSSDAMASLILQFAAIVDDIRPEDVLRDINEDRAISGFPLASGLDPIADELAERRRSYRTAICSALDKLPPRHLVETLTKTVCSATQDGTTHGPSLLDDLVDSYEREAESVLTREAETIAVLLQQARDLAPRGGNTVSEVLARIEGVFENWRAIARPLQVSMRARGVRHDAGYALAYKLRSLGVDLHNDLEMTSAALRVTEFLKAQCGDLTDLTETLRADSETLRKLLAKSQDERRDYERDIEFETEIGFFRKPLRLSIEGIDWEKRRFPLESIVRVRWGGVSHSTNGIPTGTEYTVAFSDGSEGGVVQTRDKEIYLEFTSKLWKAVCVRLIYQVLASLREGTRYWLNDMLIDDMGVELVEQHVFSPNKRVRCLWSDVTIRSGDGQFSIAMAGKPTTCGAASYQGHWNTHLWEHLIRLNFKSSAPRLSDTLKGV